MKLSIIIVNTNEWRWLQPCLASVYKETQGISFEIIVVDNASTDGSLSSIARDFPEVKVVKNLENRGFAASNNSGIRLAHGEYVLLLNPDTEVIDKAILKAVKFLDERPEAGIVGCKLRLPDGTVQVSVRGFPTIPNVFFESTFLYRIFPRSKRIGQYYMSYFDYNSELKVDWACGAFLLIRRAIFDTIGLLDEQFFLYSEEMDFCYRATKAGYATWYIPQAEVFHRWGGLNAVSPRVVLWMHGSHLLYFRKHFHGFSQFALVALKYLGIVARIGVYSLVGCCTLNRHMVKKAWYNAVAIRKLIFRKWKYIPGHSGPVLRWQE